MIDIKPFTERLKDAFRVLCWKIDSGRQTGVTINTCVGLTEKTVCEIYNIDSLKHYDKYFKDETINSAPITNR